jgi:hypothetical protein
MPSNKIWVAFVHAPESRAAGVFLDEEQLDFDFDEFSAEVVKQYLPGVMPVWLTFWKVGLFYNSHLPRSHTSIRSSTPLSVETTGSLQTQR